MLCHNSNFPQDESSSLDDKCRDQLESDDEYLETVCKCTSEDNGTGAIMKRPAISTNISDPCLSLRIQNSNFCNNDTSEFNSLDSGILEEVEIYLYYFQYLSLLLKTYQIYEGCRS